MTDNVMTEARREAAELLNLDPDNLSPAAALKCDMVSALRAVLDDELARATSGSNADLGKLITAVDHLASILKESRPPEPDSSVPEIFRRDPHKVLEEMVDRWHAAAEAERAERIAEGLPAQPVDYESALSEISDLRDEVDRLRGLLAAPEEQRALPAPAPEEGAITPPTADIVGPREQSDNPRNMRAPHGPDNPKPPVTIDHEGRPLRPGLQRLPDGRTVPIPPQAKPGHVTKAQQEKSNADRATANRVMNAPSRVAHEPAPSSPMNTFGDPVIWPVGRGRAW